MILDMTKAARVWTNRIVARGGVDLFCIDSGCDGEGAVLLLHGLAGHVGEWRQTAGWLSESRRVVAFDQRGHGASTRTPRDMSRAAFVDDTIQVIEQLDLAPVTLVGQSLGGHTAFLVAAERPDLVSSLVVVEASPQRDPLARDRVAVLLRAWPVPFPSQSAALEFFGGRSPAAAIWLEALEERDGGWWPRFECRVVLDALSEGTARSFWNEWDRVCAPTLIVRGEHGWLDATVARQMQQRAPSASLAEVAGAAHDVHLEQPAG